MSDKPRYEDWTEIPWDGNPALKLRCWRKSFGRGHVSVGIGDFDLIVYSHGADSIRSLSGTRIRPWGTMTEHQAMGMVDRNGGDHNHKDNDP